MNFINLGLILTVRSVESACGHESRSHLLTVLPNTRFSDIIQPVARLLGSTQRHLKALL